MGLRGAGRQLEAIIGAGEEGFIALDRAIHLAAELIANLRRIDGGEGIAGVKRSIAKEPEPGAMEVGEGPIWRRNTAMNPDVTILTVEYSPWLFELRV